MTDFPSNAEVLKWQIDFTCGDEIDYAINVHLQKRGVWKTWTFYALHFGITGP